MSKNLYNEMKTHGAKFDMSLYPEAFVQWFEHSIAITKSMMRENGLRPDDQRTIEIMYVAATMITVYESTDVAREMIESVLDVTPAQFLQLQLLKSIEVPDELLPEL